MSSDLHGSAPDSCPVALLIIDLINDLEFPEADQLLDAAIAVAERVAALKRRAKAAGVPVLYVNDNFGHWQSNFKTIIDHCLKDGVRGEPLAKRLQPEEDDYFVLKPKHSGFYATSLEVLLQHLGAKTLVLTGIAGDICVLFTANDAYMRDYKLHVPSDCCASNTKQQNERALEIMRNLLKADLRPSTELDFTELLKEPHSCPPGRDKNADDREVQNQAEV